MPGVSIGTRNTVMPACRGDASGSVLVASQTWLARCPPVVHIFWPLITQSPSSADRCARVFSEARSEPASGSL